MLDIGFWPGMLALAGRAALPHRLRLACAAAAIAWPASPCSGWP
jgi:hypothetical protein